MKEAEMDRLTAKETKKMETVHVRSLEKYHPGYRDRELSWGRIFINMASGDPECEELCEIDWARFVKMILLELRAKKPLPNTPEYWQNKGFDLKKRPIALTLQMLHNFVDVVSDNSKSVCIREEKNREDKRREDMVPAGIVEQFFNYFLLKTKKTFKLTMDARQLINSRLKEGYTLDQLKTAVDNFVQDDWPERCKHLDLIYCIGRQKGKPDALEKWLNFKPKSSSPIVFKED